MNDVIGEAFLLLIIVSGCIGISLAMGSSTGAGKVSGSTSFYGCMGYTSKFEVIWGSRNGSSDSSLDYTFGRFDPILSQCFPSFYPWIYLPWPRRVQKNTNLQSWIMVVQNGMYFPQCECSCWRIPEPDSELSWTFIQNKNFLRLRLRSGTFWPPDTNFMMIFDPRCQWPYPPFTNS